MSAMKRRLRETEGGFSRSTVGWAAALGVISFAVALILSAYGEDLWSEPSPHANSFSRSALGHRALVELLESTGLGVVSRRSPGTGNPGIVRPLIAAEPDPKVMQEYGERLEELRKEARAHDAALVLVLPKWRGEKDPGKPGWIASAELLRETEVWRVLRALGEDSLERVDIVRAKDGKRRVQGCSARWRSAQAIDFRVDLAPAQLLAPGSALEPEVTCGGNLLIARHQPDPEGPEIYLVSDPDLLNNHGLAAGDNAVLIYEFLTHRLGARGVIFDETVHGLRRTPGLLAEAFRFPLLLAVLQVLLLTGVLLWAGMGRFGKPLPMQAGLGSGRQVLIASTARLLTDGGHGAESLARYFQQTVRGLAAGLGLSSDLPEPELIGRLQRLSDERRLGMDLRVLEAQVKQTPEAGMATDWALSIARDLYRWRQEMMDGHRTRS